MDTCSALLKLENERKSKKKHRLLKKIESSFTFDTFKLFFHQKKLAQMTHNIDLKRTGQIGKKWGFS